MVSSLGNRAAGNRSIPAGRFWPNCVFGAGDLAALRAAHQQRVAVMRSIPARRRQRRCNWALPVAVLQFADLLTPTQSFGRHAAVSTA